MQTPEKFRKKSILNSSIAFLTQWQTNLSCSCKWKMESAFGLKLSNEVSAVHLCRETTEQSEGVTVCFGDEITGKDQ